MRILHTSDWHIGRSFVGFDLLPAQKTYIDHLIEVVKQEKVDVLLVSGDIYDQKVPSLASVSLLEYALAELSQITKVVITSGNHDSERRLGFGKNLFEQANVFLRTSLDDITRPVILPFSGKKLAIYGIPYLEPFTTSQHLIEKSDDGKRAVASHNNVVEAAIKRINEHRKTNKTDKTIVMSHAWFTGGDQSDSEINIGGLGQVSLELLKTFDYSALGHLHKPKEITEHIRYSGSALPYSFSEKSVPKLSWIVDLSGAKIQVKPIASPVYKSMHELEDTMENLLNSSKYKDFEDQFVKIKVMDKNPPVHPKIALAKRFSLIVELHSQQVLLETKNFEELKLLTPDELVATFLKEIRLAGPDEWELKQIKSVITQIQSGAKNSPDDEEECVHDDAVTEESE
jgi:exonuclease SbcD